MYIPVDLLRSACDGWGYTYNRCPYAVCHRADRASRISADPFDLLLEFIWFMRESACECISETEIAMGGSSDLCISDLLLLFWHRLVEIWLADSIRGRLIICDQFTQLLV